MKKILSKHVTNLQRRDFLGYVGTSPLLFSGSSLFALTACGSNDDPAAYPTKVSFIASSSPATDATKAIVFTDAKIGVTYSDNTVSTVNLSYMDSPRKARN